MSDLLKTIGQAIADVIRAGGAWALVAIILGLLLWSQQKENTSILRDMNGSIKMHDDWYRKQAEKQEQ